MTRRGGAGAAMLGVAVLAAACGLKSAPVAPELVVPLPPARVQAASTAAGVRLTWRRPMEYSGGGRMRDLGGFQIERAASVAGPFTPVHTLRLDDQQRFRPRREITWVDRDALAGTAYAYRVVAFTLDGDRSAPSLPATIRHEPPRDAGAR